MKKNLSCPNKAWLKSCFKVFVMAKFILILILLSSAQLFSKSFAQVEMTINLKNRTLKDALKTIEQKSDYYFLYDEQIVDSKSLVSVNVKDALIDDVMRQVLLNTRFTYELSKKLIIISPKLVADAKLAITGFVKDVNGNPIPGVSITQKNKNNSTTTNINGQFSINVDGNDDVLVFSFLGYKTQEVKVGGRNVINVQMTESLSSLNEVVVVGYGTQIRQNVTSSIGSISQKDIKDLPLTNIGQALQGKISGLQVQQTGGAPGSSPVFRVRGLGSLLAGNGPLIVLDGQALNSGDLSLIIPADIESVDVLKDASATAIYGSRGANGVVLISTKKGKSGQPRIDVNYYTAFQEVNKKLPVLNRDEFIAFSKDAYQNAYVDRYPLLDPNTPNSARPNNLKYPTIFDNPSTLPDNNYQDMIFQTAPLNNIGVSASGGNDKTLYLLSGNFTNQQGIIKSSELKRYSFRSNLETKLTKNLNVGLNISPTYTNERLVNSDNHWQNYGIINAAIELFPWLPLYQADGISYNSAQAYNLDPFYYAGVTNPVANITEINTRQTTSRLLANAFAEYSFLKGFKYRASIGTDLQQGRINNFQTSKLPRNGQLPPNVANSGYNTTVQNVNWIFTQTLDFNKSFDNKHNLGILIGTEAQANTNEFSDIRANNFPNDNVPTLNAGTITSATTLKEEWALASYFSRVSYNYKSKYLLNVSLRLDGSSRFGNNNRYGFFPAVSAGWNIAQEDFLKDNKVINTLKIKGSYGLAGNNAFGNYQSLGLLSKANYVLSNKQVNGLAVSTLPNADLTWEKSLQTDLGVDVAILNDRIAFSADYYNRITKGLLVNVPVPTLKGFSQSTTNIGQVRNRGFEFSLTTQNAVKAFRWSTSANISFNRNKVLALGANGLPILGAPGIGNVITQIGQPIGNFYAYNALGIFQNQAELDAYPHYSNSKPGDIKYEDVDKNGVINSLDQKIVGNNQPDFIYGLTNNIAYKGFDFSFVLQGVSGGEVFNFNRRFYDSLNAKYNTLSYVKNRWKSEAEPGDGMTPRANLNTTGRNQDASSRWSESASYFSVRNITLGYSIPKNVIAKAKINNARLYIGVQNAFMLSDYSGFNPEVTTVFDPGTAVLAGGVDYGAYPLSRTFTFGLNLGF